MADKKTRALTGPRQLKLMVPDFVGTYAAGTGFPSYKAWQQITPTVNTLALYFEGKIDANLSLDSLTMFPQAVMLQDPGIYFKTNSPIPDDPANDIIVLDIISVKKLDVGTVVTNITANNAPGMLGDGGQGDDFNQIIMGSFRHMTNNNQLAMGSSMCQTIAEKDFSSASPFAQDFLWCYRIIMPRSSEATGMYVSVPASRFILNVVVAHEDDLPYMMRLKNSYELQQ